MRISAFVDGSDNKHSAFVGDWRCSPKEVNMTQRTYTGWTAFVYQLPDDLGFSYSCAILCVRLCSAFAAAEGGVTKNTVNFHESAACASHSGIAQSPWR